MGNRSGRAAWSGDGLQLVHQIGPGRGRGKRFSVGMVEGDRFIHDHSELIEHAAFVSSMAATEEQAGTASDMASVFIRPFDNLDVVCAFFHCRDSLMARRTARIRYR